MFRKITKYTPLSTNSYFVCFKTTVTQRTKESKKHLECTNELTKYVTPNIINTSLSFSSSKKLKFTTFSQATKSKIKDQNVNNIKYTITYISIAVGGIVIIAIVIIVFVCKKIRNNSQANKVYEEITERIMPTCDTSNSLSNKIESFNTSINNDPCYYSVINEPEGFYLEMGSNKSNLSERKNEGSRRLIATDNFGNNINEDTSQSDYVLPSNASQSNEYEFESSACINDEDNSFPASDITENLGEFRYFFILV